MLLVFLLQCKYTIGKTIALNSIEKPPLNYFKSGFLCDYF
jgi:hypothetical protein